MKTFKLTALAMSVLALASCGNKAPQLGKAPVKKVIEAMTLEEKAHLIVGIQMEYTESSDQAVVGASADRVPGAAGATYPIERLGIPSVVLADGPAGLRINPTREGDDATYYCTHFPIGTLLASTWNQELVESVGESIGEEVLEYGADVLLAPALNIHRNPLNGRNFEYYSEDPVVSGKTAAAYVRGIQSNGVGTSIKHFAYNNQETNRMGNNAIIAPRAQREIYLKGFEIAVKESDPWTVMSSYNKINGVYTSESKDLQTTVLRGDWGYKGVVMTDWFGGTDGAAQMWAGNDMLQPGTKNQYDQIIAAVNAGTLSMEDIDRNVENILNMVLRTPVFKGYKYGNKPNLDAHAQVTRQSALEGMVLLENKGVLPFSADVKNVAVFGNTSFNFIAGGTGSGNVNRAYTVSLIDGLKNGGYNVDETLSQQVAAQVEKCHNEYVAKMAELGQYAAFLPEPLAPEVVPSAAQLAKMVAANDIAVITLGRISGEFVDRTSADFNLSKEEKALVNAVCGAFHAAGKKAVVILNIGGVIETASWKNMPDAILLAWQAGQEGGNSVTDILSGKQSPSGKLTMTWPLGLMDAKSSANFPIDQTSSIDLVNKKENQNIKNVDYTVYEEGIYVGYRWFDKQDLQVSYPFGYGLSYTSFEYSEPTVQVAGGKVNVSVTVKNTGAVAGKEAVQLYVAAPASSLDKPVKELKAYAKTKALEPGESQVLKMSFDTIELASYDEAQSAWVVDGGEYTFCFGASSRDLRQAAKATVEAQTQKTADVLHK